MAHESQTFAWRLTLRDVLAVLLTAFALSILGSHPTLAQSFVPLYEFPNGQDGAIPYAGLTIDRAGNLYGTTEGGGICQPACGGIVFMLKNTRSGWLFTPIYAFARGNDGSTPEARVVFGPDGTLYGTTSGGGGVGCGSNGCGTVFNLRPPATVCKTALCPWTETVLYRFSGGMDGAGPSFSDLIFDQAGNIYGTTIEGGGVGCNGQGCGTVFRLTQSGRGQWTESVLYSFTGGDDGSAAIGVTLDAMGNLYGTAFNNSTYGCGAVFQLISSGSGWAENTLYAFNPTIGDGCNPLAAPTLDRSGNLYGTATNGGYQGGGTVFQLSPNRQGGWTETTAYAFTSGIGYQGPIGALTLDTVGNLYGTTYGDGAYGEGGAFELTMSGDGWIYSSLHDFIGYGDGEFPVGNVTFDSSGRIYGTATQGGQYGDGVVWQVIP